MKYFCFVIFILLLFSCKKEAEHSIIPGTISETRWIINGKDTLFWVYSLYTTKESELGSSGRIERYSHESSSFTVFKLSHNSLELKYQKEASCIDHKNCGSRIGDKIIGFSNNLMAFKCFCEGKFLFIDLVTGEDWATAETFKDKMPEYKGSISEYYSFPARPDCLKIDFSDGKTGYFSLEEKRMVKYDKSFDYGTEVNHGALYAYIGNHKIHFEKNRDDNRYHIEGLSKKGKNSDEDDWLNPKLANRINSIEAATDEEFFYAFHSNSASPSDNRPLLSKIDLEGKRIYTIDLDSYDGYNQCFIGKDFIYIDYREGIRVLDTKTGKEVKMLIYKDVKK